MSLAIAIVGNIGMWAVVIVLPAMQSEFGTGRADATYPYILAMIGFAAGNLILGRAVDRWGIVPVLVAAGLASAFGFSLSSIAPSMALLSLLHFVLGLGASATFGPLIADLSQWFRRRRGIAVALAASGNYLSGVVWPPVIVWLMDGADWRWAYLWLGIAMLAFVVPGAFLLRRQIEIDYRFTE